MACRRVQPRRPLLEPTPSPRVSSRPARRLDPLRLVEGPRAAAYRRKDGSDWRGGGGRRYQSLQRLTAWRHWRVGRNDGGRRGRQRLAARGHRRVGRSNGRRRDRQRLAAWNDGSGRFRNVCWRRGGAWGFGPAAGRAAAGGLPTAGGTGSGFSAWPGAVGAAFPAGFAGDAGAGRRRWRRDGRLPGAAAEGGCPPGWPRRPPIGGSGLTTAALAAGAAATATGAGGATG